MIVKKIPRLADGAGINHAQHVRNLVNYMKQPDKGSGYAEALLRYLQEEGIEVEGVERLHHLNASNFLTETIEGRRAEMMASASQAVRSPNPLSHWLISWRERERPSPEEIDEAAEMFLSHLGLGKHQAIYAAHADTHNFHLHIAVNRYDPFRNRMLKVNGGFDLEAAHAAIALITDKQGWDREENARYEIVGGKAKLTAAAEAAKKDGRKTLGVVAASYEARTGLKSTQRIAIEEAGPAMLAARSWSELHFALAEKGIEYIPSRSGAVLKINNEHVTASSAHRRCSHGKLVGRLGDYKPRLRSVTVRERTLDESAMDGAIRADEFANLRSNAAAARKQSEETIRSDRDRQLCEVTEAAELDRSRLDRLRDGGRSPERTALLTVIKEKEERALDAVKARADADLEQVKVKHRRAADYEDWLRSQNENYLADRWRNRRRLKEWIGAFVGTPSPEHSAANLNGYHATKIQGGVRWAREGAPTAFIEWGDRIEVTLPRDEDAILTAFRLAQMKYGMVTIIGPAAFQERAVAIVMEHGLGSRIANPDWRKLLDRQQRSDERTIPQPPILDSTIRNEPASAPVEQDQEQQRDHALAKALKDRNTRGAAD